MEGSPGRGSELVVNRTFWQQFFAVLAGNLIYLAVEPHLPPRGQHQMNRIDWGLAVDFWICLVCYGLLRMVWRG
jgi:hypothetical protein